MAVSTTESDCILAQFPHRTDLSNGIWQAVLLAQGNPRLLQVLRHTEHLPAHCKQVLQDIPAVMHHLDRCRPSRRAPSHHQHHSPKLDQRRPLTRISTKGLKKTTVTHAQIIELPSVRNEREPVAGSTALSLMFKSFMYLLN